MRGRIPHKHSYMIYFLLVHLLLVVALPAFFTLYGGIWDYLIILVVGTLVLGAVDYHYAVYLFWTLAFLIFLVRELIISNFVMAWHVIHPKPNFDPGIIGIPLTVSSGLEITVLAICVALTPGTLVIDLGRNAENRQVLYVHTIHVGNPEKFRTSIQNGFERMILNISRGVTHE